MLKGDLRKKQILETAEKLFCQNGYERTSVQDILDILHLSKGSFYHHYESKELLLSCICEKRAQASAEEQKNREHKTGIEGVDEVLSAMIPFNGAGLQFLSMILPAFALPEGRSVRASYQLALKQAFLPLLLNAFDSALAGREIFSEDPSFLAGICLDLVNDLWSAVSERMIAAPQSPGEDPDQGEMLGFLEQYRTVLERVMIAPYGSLRLIGLEDLAQLSREITEQGTARQPGR